jgi:hypothetical protein
MSVEKQIGLPKNPVRDDIAVADDMAGRHTGIIPDGIQYRIRNIFYRHSVPDGTWDLPRGMAADFGRNQLLLHLQHFMSAQETIHFFYSRTVVGYGYCKYSKLHTSYFQKKKFDRLRRYYSVLPFCGRLRRTAFWQNLSPACLF